MLAYNVFETAWGPFAYLAECVGAKTTLLATYLPGLSSAKLAKLICADRRDVVQRPRLWPQFEHQVQRFFEGWAVDFDVSIDLSEATPFRRRVLMACRQVPYGTTATYGELARAAGRAQAGRAVGSAMACNPLPLVIPCHRILRSDGRIGGFSSPLGVDQKQRMLELEAAA